MNKLAVILFCLCNTLSCAKSNTYTGVNIDAEGRLIIDIPLYMVDDFQEIPQLKIPEESFAEDIDLFMITKRKRSRKKIAVAHISGNRLFAAVPIPASDDLNEIGFFSWNESEIAIGNVTVSGAYDGAAFRWIDEYKLKKGWNIVCVSERIDEETNITTTTTTNKKLPDNAVWVIW